MKKEVVPGCFALYKGWNLHPLWQITHLSWWEIPCQPGFCLHVTKNLGLTFLALLRYGEKIQRKAHNLWCPLTSDLIFRGFGRWRSWWGRKLPRLKRVVVTRRYCFGGSEIPFPTNHRLDVWIPVNNGIFTISTGAGFLPSTVWFQASRTKGVAKYIRCFWICEELVLMVQIFS